MNLREFRSKYPQYDDMSDRALADALHRKFYSDIPIEDYYRRIGLLKVTPTEPAQPDSITGMESAFVPTPSEPRAKKPVVDRQVTEPAPYKSRAEAIDDLINLAEEGVPLDKIKEQSSRLKIDFAELVKRGKERNSPMFQTGTMEPVPVEVQKRPSGSMREFEPTAMQEFLNVGRRGIAQLDRERALLRYQTGQISETEAAERLRLSRRKMESARASGDVQAGLERLNAANESGDFSETAKAIVNPSNLKALLALVAESAIPSLANLPTTIASGLAGGPGGAALANFATSYASEYANALGDTLETAGVSMSDPFAVSRALKDPNILEEAKLRGMNRGVPVAAFDALSAGIGGKFLSSYLRALKAAGAQATRKGLGLAAAKEAGVQVGSGMAGEAVAQAATDERKPLDIFVEGLAELFPGVAEVATNVARTQPRDISESIPKEIKDEPVSYERRKRAAPTLGGEGIRVPDRPEPTIPADGTPAPTDRGLVPAEGAPRLPERREEVSSDTLKEQIVNIASELSSYDANTADFLFSGVRDPNFIVTQDDVDIAQSLLESAKERALAEPPAPAAPVEETAAESNKKVMRAAVADLVELAQGYSATPEQIGTIAQKYDIEPWKLEGVWFDILDKSETEATSPNPLATKEPTNIIDITQKLEDREDAELERYMTEGTNEYAKSLITPEVNKKLEDTLKLAKAALLNKQRAENNLEEEIYFPSDYEDAKRFADNLSGVYSGLENNKLAYAELVVPNLIKEAEVLSESLQKRIADNLDLKREKKLKKVDQPGLTVVPRTKISTLSTTPTKEPPSAPTPTETVETKEEGAAAPAEGAAVAAPPTAEPAAPLAANNEALRAELDDKLSGLVEQQKKLLTSKGAIPAKKSKARIAYDALGEEIEGIEFELDNLRRKINKERPTTSVTTKEEYDRRKAKLESDIASLTNDQSRLLTSAGNIPAVNSKGRERYDILENQLQAKKKEYLTFIRTPYAKTGVPEDTRVEPLEGERKPAKEQMLPAQRKLLEKLEKGKAKPDDEGSLRSITEMLVGAPTPTGTTSETVSSIRNVNPSLRRAVAKYYRRYQEGKITAKNYAEEVNRIYEETKQGRELADLVRGQLYFRERLLKSERAGELPPGTLEFTEWFIGLNPALLDDVSISIRGPRKGRDEISAGEYLPLPRIVRLFIDNMNSSTAVHELLHHFERMMPEKLQAQIREMWLNALIDKLNRSSPGSSAREYLTIVHNVALSDKRNNAAISYAVNMIARGEVPPSYYQYINPSEFWAVNATEIMQGRFEGTTSVISRIKQWITELVAKIKGYFGLPSNALLIRALDSLIKADGEYKSKSLLNKRISGYYSFAGQKSIDYSSYDPQEIADDKTRKEGNLKQAKALEANGASPIEIWNKTGWLHSKIDDQWRYEINDSKATFKTDFWTNLPEVNAVFSSVASTPENERTTIGEILDHPELYRAYPELKDVVVFKRKSFLDWSESVQGYFSSDGTITITPYAKNPFSTLLHEIQHWIQRKEGFGPGGNAESVQLANNVDILELLKERYEYILDEARKVYPETSDSRKLITDTLRKIVTLEAAIDNQFELSKSVTKRNLLGNKEKSLEKELNDVGEGIKNTRQEIKSAVDVAVSIVKGKIDAIDKQVEAQKQKVEKLKKEISDLFNQKIGVFRNNTFKRDQISSLIEAKKADQNILYEQIDKAARDKKEELQNLRLEKRKLENTVTYTGQFISGPPEDPTVLAAVDKLNKLTKREDELKKEIKQAKDEHSVAKDNYNKLENSLGAAAGRASVIDIKYDLYQMISGEIEARNTQARQEMTEEERRQKPPSETADISEKYAFLNTFGQEGALYSIRGPISGKSKWRTVEDVSKTLIGTLNNALKNSAVWNEVSKTIVPAIWNPVNGKLRRAWLYTATLRQMADVTRDKFPQLAAAINIVDKMTSFRLKKLNDAREIAVKWINAQNKNLKQSELLGKIMLDATIEGLDPAMGTTNPELDAAWASLDPEFQQIYVLVRDYFANNLKEMVRDMKLKALRLPKHERQAAIRKINEMFGPDKLKTPYFPLRRFGEYWFQVGSGKFKEFYEFESETGRELARLARKRELEAGNAQQKKLAETIKYGAGVSELITKNLATTEVIKKIDELVDSILPRPPLRQPGGPVPPAPGVKTQDEIRKEIKDGLNQLMYIMLPQQSLRKMFINRKGIQGASGDMLRVFADVAVHSAYQMSRVKYNNDFINNINKAYEYVNEYFTPDKAAMYRDYVLELDKRTKTILSAEDKSLAAKMAGAASSTTFYWMLSAPFTSMLNLLGFAVFTGSKLGGTYGYAKATEVLLRNAGRYAATTPGRTFSPIAQSIKQKKPSLALAMQFPSIVEGGKLPPLLQRAADEFINQGQINISLTNDIFDLSDRPSELYTTRYEVIKKILSGLFHQSERLNREVALMSTFELEYERLLNAPKRDMRGFILRDANGDPEVYSPDEAFDAAIDEAKRVAGLTLGDFSRQMKSRLFANIPLSIILKFKQYAFMATYNYMRPLLTGLTPSFSEKERKELTDFFVSQNLSQPEIDRRIKEVEEFKRGLSNQARKEALGILGVTFLLGGLEAMPFFWLGMPMLAAMFAGDEKDDDELFSYVNWFRRWASSWLGGESFARGPVSQLVGGSLSERVSLDPKNMFYRDGRYSSDIEESIIEEIIANSGPVVGLGMNMVNAFKLYSEGQYYRAVEKAMPAFFQKPMQAYRYGTEGAVTRSGEVQMPPEDFSGWMLAMQAVGLQPESLAMIQKRAIQTKESEQKLLSKEKGILDVLWQERENEKGFEDALYKAVEFYEKYPAMLGESTLPDKIERSFETRQKLKNEAEAIGARLDKRTMPYVGQMLETPTPKPPAMTVKEVRQNYPQYDDMTDEQLAAALKAKGLLKE